MDEGMDGIIHMEENERERGRGRAGLRKRIIVNKEGNSVSTPWTNKSFKGFTNNKEYT
jgi:hypothetical protein